MITDETRGKLVYEYSMEAVKDYNGATMMECSIDKHVDYLGTRRLGERSAWLGFG